MASRVRRASTGANSWRSSAASPIRFRTSRSSVIPRRASTLFMGWRASRDPILSRSKGKYSRRVTFCSRAARAGSRVTVLQRAERMLPAFDADLVGWLMEKFHELGIDVRTRSTAQRIEKTADGYLVDASTDGRTQRVTADLVVHAAGRTPDLEPLHLDVAGVTTENGRLKLNEY